MIAAALVGVVVVAAVGGADALAAAAAASGRPPECAPTTGSARARDSVWRRARMPDLGRYCDLVAQAQARLVSDPAKARADALAAEGIGPGRAAPKVLLARAELALGDVEAAMRAFDDAIAKEGDAVEAPEALEAFARALARSGRREEALAAYRRLVPRVPLLPGAEARALALHGAGRVALAAAREKLAGASPELAVAWLREARALPRTRLAGDVLYALALALARSGDVTGSEVVVAEARRDGLALTLPPGVVRGADDDDVALAALATRPEPKERPRRTPR